MKRLLIRGGIALLLLEVAVGFSGLENTLLLHPSREALPSGGASERVLHTSRGDIQVWTSALRAGRVPRAYLLRFYGNADRADSNVGPDAATFADNDVVVWGVNYPGFGESTGSATLAGVGRSALDAYDALKPIAGDAPIVVWGTSIGTTAALHVAAERPVAGLIAQDAPPLPELIRGTQGAWNAWLLALPLSLRIPRAVDSMQNARNCNAPTLFVTSGNDELVPPQYQAIVFDAYRGPKTKLTIPDGYHYAPWTREVIERARAYLRGVLGTPAR